MTPTAPACAQSATPSRTRSTGQEACFAETFVTAASPGCVLTIMHNVHYASDRDYLFALATGAEDGIRVHRLARPPAPDRRAGPRHGALPLLPRCAGCGLPRQRGRPHRGAQHGARRCAARAGAPARVLGHLGRAACRRYAARAPPAAALRSRGGRAQHPLCQPRPPARVRDGAQEPAARTRWS